MNKEELREKYKSLYNYMSVSNEPKYMMLFGDVMNEMMRWMIDNKQDLAEKMVEKLCAIKWKQYLTYDEAVEAVSKMKPSAPWDYSTWEKAMKDLGLDCERESFYNKYANYAVMCQVYTDFAETIAKAMKAPIANIPNDTFLPIINDMALDLLLDKDQRYSVRSYLIDK